MKESYLTIQSKATGLFKEKGSRFMAYAFPVDSTTKIKSHVQHLKSKYHDARHHCYAYVLGPEGKEVRANDDGEPNHSAGDIILRTIRSRELTNVLIVVVRYFGGIKLGISGLINAYKSSSEAALQTAKIIKVDILRRITITFPYSGTNEVMQVLSRLNVTIEEQDFQEICKIRIGVKVNLVEDLIRLLDQLLARKIIQSFQISANQ